MASHRILKPGLTVVLQVFLATLLFMSVHGCETADSLLQTSDARGTADDDPPLENRSMVHHGTEEHSEDGYLDKEHFFNQTRSTLQDQFPKSGIKIPDAFRLDVINEDTEPDPFAGFRVQILSTRDVIEADSVKDSFRVLSDSLFTGYTPSAYIHFRSPYYRVRIGDFTIRERAIQFSGMIKDLFPDAWVVYDRIQPEQVPADSIEIRSIRIRP